MERTTKLYQELEVCEVFGRWHEEFVLLNEEEQHKHMRYVMLRNAKRAYANTLEKDKPTFFAKWWGLGG